MLRNHLRKVPLRKYQLAEVVVLVAARYRGAVCLGFAPLSSGQLPHVLVSEFPQIIPRNITSRSNVTTAYVRPGSLGCTLHVPFFLSRLPMAEEFFRSGI
jgi:hypothetical protein